MSSNATATLFYGFPLPALVVDYHDLNDGWEKSHRPTEPADRSDYRSQQWEAWRVRLRDWEETAENVRIDWSGSENCEQYFIHLAGLRKTVEWNELLVVSPEALSAVPAGAIEMLHAFCDRFNLPKKVPQWHLSARYF